MTNFGNFEDRHPTVRTPGLSGFSLDCRIAVVNMIHLTMAIPHKLPYESYSPWKPDSPTLTPHKNWNFNFEYLETQAPWGSKEDSSCMYRVIFICHKIIKAFYLGDLYIIDDDEINISLEENIDIFLAIIENSVYLYSILLDSI